MYPSGFHPIKQRFLPDAVTPAWPISRAKAGVRYYYVDFGISVFIPPNQPKLVTGILGRDREPPELSSDDPYDPFKLDIFILGNVFRREFHDVGTLFPDTGAFNRLLMDVSRNSPTSTSCRRLSGI